MAANRSQTMYQALTSIWARGGVAGFYQGLIPWVSLVTVASANANGCCRPGLRLLPRELCSCSPLLRWKDAVLSAGINPGAAGLLGGMTGGIAQAYATMGMLAYYRRQSVLQLFRHY
jgi:hypothetical protein